MRPPKHRADAPAIYVHHDDPAWDKDRIESDMAAMEKAGEDPQQHPWVQHCGGYTRYDLDAPHTVCGDVRCARDYLGSDAVQWRLQKLDWEQWDEVQAMWLSSISNKEPAFRAFSKALRYALKSVEGPGAPELVGIGKYLTYADMQTLHELSHSGEKRFRDIRKLLGQAAYTASMPLTDAEEKP